MIPSPNQIYVYEKKKYLCITKSEQILNNVNLNTVLSDSRQKRKNTLSHRQDNEVRLSDAEKLNS